MSLILAKKRGQSKSQRQSNCKIIFYFNISVICLSYVLSKNFRSTLLFLITLFRVSYSEDGIYVGIKVQGLNGCDPRVAPLLRFRPKLRTPGAILLLINFFNCSTSRRARFSDGVEGASRRSVKLDFSVG